MPLKNNQTSYQRLQEDLDYRLDRMNQAREAAFNAVNQPATSPSSNSKSVVRRQQQLQKMGFYKGAIDGDWGSGSKRAHEAALAKGYILNSHGMYVKKPQAQTRVTPKAYTQTEQRQAQLKQLGFYKGKIDNNFGSGSRAAHQAAIDAGYVYENGEYKLAANLPTELQLASIGPNGSLYTRGSVIGEQQFDNPTERQQQLKGLGFYEGKVDGDFGNDSKIAHQAALTHGYEYKDGKYKRSIGRTIGEAFNRGMNAVHSAADFAGSFIAPLGLALDALDLKDKTPAGTFASDVVNTAKNKVWRNTVGKILGKGDEWTPFKQSDVTSLPDDQMKVLRAQYESLPDNRKNGGQWTGNDYRRTTGNYARGDRLLARTTVPEDMIANTLGQYNYSLDDKGNVIVTDTYDFSEGYNGAEGKYNTVRKFASNYASGEKDPDAQKKHYKINLGNPNAGWIVIK